MTIDDTTSRPAGQQNPPAWPLPPQTGAPRLRPVPAPQQQQATVAQHTEQDAGTPTATPGDAQMIVRERPLTPEVILGRLRATYNPCGFLILWDGRGTWSALRGLTLIQRLTPLDLRIAIDTFLAAAAPAPALAAGPARYPRPRSSSPERNRRC